MAARAGAADGIVCTVALVLSPRDTDGSRALSLLFTMFRCSALSLLVVFCSAFWSPVLAFLAPLTLRHTNNARASRSSLVMKDNSSANVFNVGDRVRVVDDVAKAGTNLRGRVGTVKETWTKCEVDPTCCCAEFVDDGFAVHVSFDRDATTDGPITAEDTFVHYFAERELIEEKEENDAPPVAFDGMSCQAFKLNQLKMGEQAQRIAAYEASKTGDDR
uniref:Uncharacterized protein n=1 Tax=Minutocellus polymorphus TaxID=265543 RepID=A0A7S0FRB8_9STRA